MNFTILMGGLIGYWVGSGRGLLIGAFIGWLLSRVLPQFALRFAVGKVRQIQSQFLDSTFAVMGAVCKADGVVTSEEIEVAERLFAQLNLTGAARDSAKRAFNRGKEPGFDLDAEVQRFLLASRGQRVLHQMFMQVQLSAIAADGRLHPAEHAMLLRIARGLGMTEAEIASLEALLRGGGNGGGRRPDDPSRLDDAYRVLGVTPDASDAEVKRAYRQLMSQNHPDKLAAKGLPESMRALAEQKTREITGAYERIENARRRT
ncbi:MAG: co-chaperone DjlA [Nevskia sp.]